MILVTGFEPFGGLAVNPSAQAARLVEGGEVRAAILPVDFRGVGPALSELLVPRWDAVLLMGVAVGRSKLSLERVALNYRDPGTPDNSGRRPERQEVVAGGPAAYFSTLPVDLLRDRLLAAGVPVDVSLSAGAYLCNAAFYLARHRLEARGTPCGFLHLPATPEIAGPAPSLPLDEIVRGIRILLREMSGPAGGVSAAPPS